MNIGEIKEICFHKDNIVIPSGYIECDGREITEDEYPELFYHLSGNREVEKINLPFVEDEIINDEYLIKKIISYKEAQTMAPNYDGEFTSKQVKNNVSIKYNNICTIRKKIHSS
jgi:hypothetical protein